MDTNFYLWVAGGIVFIGLLFVFVDGFATKLSQDRDRARTQKPEADSFYGVGNHRMRRAGLWAVGAGVVAAMLLLIAPRFDSFPSERVIVKISNAITAKVMVPWGQINLVAALIFVAVAIFLFAAGKAQWKQGGRVRPICCFVLGVVILLEGLFQWK